MKSPYYALKVSTSTYALMFRTVIKLGVVHNERIASGMTERACKHAVKLHNEDYNKRHEVVA